MPNLERKNAWPQNQFIADQFIADHFVTGHFVKGHSSVLPLIHGLLMAGNAALTQFFKRLRRYSALMTHLMSLGCIALALSQNPAADARRAADADIVRQRFSETAAKSNPAMSVENRKQPASADPPRRQSDPQPAAPGGRAETGGAEGEAVIILPLPERQPRTIR